MSRVKYWTFVVTIVSLITALLAWLYYAKIKPSFDEEDRPPIIITNGSTIFEAQPDTTGDRGELDQDGEVWYHEHPRQGPKKFEITLQNSSDCPNGMEIETKSIAITSSDGTSTFHYQVFVSSFLGVWRYLEIYADRQNASSPNIWTVTLPGKMNLLEFKGKMGAGSEQAYTCHWNDNPRIMVAQRHK